MSFGSYAESSLLISSLTLAYSTSILVAAAGNDEFGLDPCGDDCKRFFPAAYSYVLATQSSTGVFSNFDQSGPIYTPWAELWNYEVYAPGANIMSTIPNGGYAQLSGTSMSAPLLAGALALYNQIKPDDSKERIFGNFINTLQPSSNDFDLLSAIIVEPTPSLAVISSNLSDDINSQNANGFFEPGETIEIFPMIKNYWGTSR